MWTNKIAATTMLTVLGTCGAAADGTISTEGQAVFNRWCAGCHAPLDNRKTMLAGTYVLQQRYKDTRPAALEQRTDLTRAFITQIVRSGRNIMPPARKTEISDRQLEALASYLAKE